MAAPLAIPVVLIVVIFGVLARYFRRIFISVALTLLAEIVLFIVFPQLLVKFVQFVTAIHFSR